MATQIKIKRIYHPLRIIDGERIEAWYGLCYTVGNLRTHEWVEHTQPSESHEGARVFMEILADELTGIPHPPATICSSGEMYLRSYLFPRNTGEILKALTAANARLGRQVLAESYFYVDYPVVSLLNARRLGWEWRFKGA